MLYRFACNFVVWNYLNIIQFSAICLGVESRNRTIISSLSCGGSCSSNFSQVRQCSNTLKIDCELNTWSVWSICSSGCGNGTQQKSRTVKTQPSPCGVQCGSLNSFQQCQSFVDNRNCQVSEQHIQQAVESDSSKSFGIWVHFEIIKIKYYCCN